ncbi:hypothetical protein CDD81_738 [Ophiocordyceps australis]|uniref:Uncharacterized protein n=1 Tax=Ophiocordyceps australis TaxID=1399860 RepID=A0A2C5Y188_9HYPO|nr:hypothetical protein CDD81_738 [Ophiocordyceps australis]
MSQDGILHLGAGQMHGVYQHDDYLLFPFDTPEDETKLTDSNQRGPWPVKVKVETVQSLDSNLIASEKDYTLVSQEIRFGLKAKPITFLSPLKIPIHLGASVRQYIHKTIPDQLPFLCFQDESEGSVACIYHVNLNRQQQFEISDSLQRPIANLPVISVKSPGASNRIMRVLQHIALYKYYEGVENRTVDLHFEKTFRISKLDDNIPMPSGEYRVQHNSTWGFTIENLGDKPLYIALFNFTPEWKISNLFSDKSGSPFCVIQPMGQDNANKEEFGLEMEIPESLQKQGNKNCEDIIKVFFTRRPTHFPTLKLPGISLDEQDTFRGSASLWSNFLEELNGPFRNSDPATSQQWSTRQYIIQTTME